MKADGRSQERNSLVSTTHRFLTALVLVSSWSLLQTAPSALGQEVEWRSDYNAARKEAASKNRPLIIDFGTENCFWCKKLDAITFKDPSVVSLMNEKFVPMKVDAEREAPLTTALHIESYPTLVFATADGKILEMHPGFLEAPRFLEKLQKVLAGAPENDWMARDYEGAAKAIASADYAKAIGLLKHILEDNGQKPIQAKARQLVQDLEQQAEGRLARAKQLVDRGQTTEAMETLTELVRTFAGTQAAKEGGTMLTAIGGKEDAQLPPRQQRARELLAQARQAYRSQQYLECLRHCDVLQVSFPDLSEGNEAGQLAAEIKNNPEWMRLACDTLSDQLGSMYLNLADTWLKKGQPQQAVLALEKVVQTLPGSRMAEIAQLRLAQIQGQPTRPVDYKKP
jgi:thioredoxin-like negative regulator of GroEL